MTAAAVAAEIIARFRLWLMVGIAILIASKGAALPLATGDAPDHKDSSYPVLHYLDLKNDAVPAVVLAGGKNQGLFPGMVLVVYRRSSSHVAPAHQHPSQDTVLVETGRVKIAEAQADHSIAMIEEQGSALSRVVFPKYPGIMAADMAVSRQVTLARRQILTPKVTLSYFDLFDDPKASPATFELRRQGLAQLNEAAAVFAKARLSTLMVEGYTDTNGSAQTNQIESYQRALTVRQYLIDELGFDEHRVVAVGFGEAEPLVADYTPGYVKANRRIVLKALSANAP